MKSLLLLLAACDGPSVVHMPGAPHPFVVDSIALPTSNQQIRENALDLDGDAVADNALGLATATMIGSLELDLNPSTAAEIASGDIAPAIEVDADSLIEEDDAAFVIDDHVLYGKLAKSRLHAGPAPAVMTFGWPDRAPIVLPLVGARVSFTVKPDGTLDGVLGGGLEPADVESMLVPALVETGNAIIARDCSASCACSTNAAHEWTLLAADGTCTLTAESVLANRLVASLVAPDVELEGHMVMSAAVRITAHPR